MHTNARILTFISDLRRLIGGEYSADLTRAKTSILIIPLATGEKYRFAQEWGVPCATPDWVEASKSAGHIVPWQDYPVPQPFKDHPPTSTPFNSMVLPKCMCYLLPYLFMYFAEVINVFFVCSACSF